MPIRTTSIVTQVEYVPITKIRTSAILLNLEYKSNFKIRSTTTVVNIEYLIRIPRKNSFPIQIF